MADPIFLMYADDRPIYLEGNAVALPLARCMRLRTTPKAWLMANLESEEEAWFPEKCFRYHWHVTSATQMQPVLSVPRWLIGKKAAFFGGV